MRNFIMAIRTGWWAARNWRRLSFLHFETYSGEWPYVTHPHPLTVRHYLASAPFAAANRAQARKDGK
jgi:hypothetical protein